jgi:glycine/D-amino acid oxidase-like deaminating enzyme
MIDDFIHSIYKYSPTGSIDYIYKWHGLMGYTPSGVRIIGPEPRNKILLYNLGCNGVGLLPSIYGGKKISLFINGENLPASIFDPKE